MIARIFTVIFCLIIPMAVLAQDIDSHFIQNDDYFIADKDLEGSSWIYVEVAKMIQAPGPETKGEAKFLVVRDGKEKWTRHYWQTRKVHEEEIKLGLPVIIFNHKRGANYIPPGDRRAARTRRWFMAKITDTSTIYKGSVLVSGGYTVSTDNLRLIHEGGEMAVEAVKTHSEKVAHPVTPVAPAHDRSDGRFLKIIEATYGGFLPENTVDVTARLQSLVRDGKLNAKADDRFLNVNMQSGFQRTLRIKYETNEGIFETAVIGGMETNLPDKYHRKVR